MRIQPYRSRTLLCSFTAYILALLLLSDPNPAAAQSISLLASISPPCAAQLEHQYFSRDLSDCLNFRGQASFPVAFFSSPKGESTLDGVGRYLEKTLCARPACPPAALNTTYTAVTSSCTSADLSAPTSAPGFFATFLQLYAGFRDTACLYDKGAGKEGCWIGMLRAMEEVKGIKIDQETLFGLLEGNASAVRRLTAPPLRGSEQNEKAAICTDCTKALYISLFKTQHTQEPLVNSNATEALVKPYLTSLCGAAFLQEPLSMPASVVQGAVKGGIAPGQTPTNAQGVTGGPNAIQHGGHPTPDNATTPPTPTSNGTSTNHAAPAGNGGYNSSDVAPVVGNHVTTLPSAAGMSLGETIEFALVFDAVLFIVLFVVTVPLLVH